MGGETSQAQGPAPAPGRPGAGPGAGRCPGAILAQRQAPFAAVTTKTNRTDAAGTAAEAKPSASSVRDIGAEVGSPTRIANRRQTGGLRFPILD